MHRLFLAAVCFASAAGVAIAAVPEAVPLKGMSCMMANAGQGRAPVYAAPDPRGPAVNASMPVVHVVLDAAGAPRVVRAPGGAEMVEMRTPSNHRGWIERRLLQPYRSASDPRAVCIPVVMRDAAGRVTLGIR